MRSRECPDCGATTNAERSPNRCLACGWVDGGRPGADVARATDPETSKAAAELVTASGARRSQREVIRAWVQAHPGRIRSEIAAGTGLTDHQAGRRISDEIRGGALVYGDARDGQQTVWPAEQQSGFGV